MGGEEVRFDAFVDQQYDRLLMMRRTGPEDSHDCRNEEDSRSDPDRRCRETGDQKSGTFFISDVDRSPVVTGDFVGEIAEDIRRHLKCCEIPDVQAFPMGSFNWEKAIYEGIYSYKNVFSFADKKQKVYRQMKPGNILWLYRQGK